MTSLVAMPELAALVVLALRVTLTFCGNQSEVSSSLPNTVFGVGLCFCFVYHVFAFASLVGEQAQWQSLGLSQPDALTSSRSTAKNWEELEAV